MSQYISEYVRYDYARRGELDADPSFHADDQNHAHRKDGKQKFVVQSGISAYQSDDCMKQGEQVDQPCYFYVFQLEHYSKLLPEVNDFACFMQSFVSFHHENPALRRCLLTLRQGGKRLLINNDYLRKLTLT